MAFQKRSMAVTVRMTPGEHALITRAAEVSGMSISDFILTAALKKALEVKNSGKQADEADTV